jgi:hypothetical protein
MRTSVYALDKAFNVALYAVSGPLAALLATRAFGFVDPPRDAPLRADLGGNAAAAGALEGALLCLLVVPRVAIVLMLNVLYFTLPLDRAAAAAAEEDEECAGVKGDASDEECGHVEAGSRLVPAGFAARSPFEGQDQFIVMPYKTSAGASDVLRLSQRLSAMRQALSRHSKEGSYAEAGKLAPAGADGSPFVTGIPYTLRPGGPSLDTAKPLLGPGLSSTSIMRRAFSKPSKVLVKSISN